MNNHEFEARFAALEVMVFAIARSLNWSDFVADFRDEKEAALAALLNNPTVSDEMHDKLEEVLSDYESKLTKDMIHGV